MLARVVEIMLIVFLGGGLVSLNGTGFSSCSEPGAAATLCDGALCGPSSYCSLVHCLMCCSMERLLLLALHTLSHSVVEVVVARFDHLGYQLEEGVRSEVVGMAMLHGSPALPVLLAVMVSRRPKVRDLIT